MARRDLKLTRRDALRAGALGAAAVAVGGVGAVGAGTARADVTQATPLAPGVSGLDSGWLFGPYATGAEQPGYGESGMAGVTLPHTVTPLSWSEWTPSSWEQRWIYRLHVTGAALSAGRSFVDFQGVMTSATVYLNGTPLGTHLGGYLPFTVELTEGLVAGDNVLAVIVDGTLQDVPPNDVAKGDAAIDFLQPAGIYRDVSVRIVPEVFVSDVFAQPTDVLGGSPGLQAQVTLDAATVPSGPVTVSVSVLSGSTVVGSAATSATVSQTGPTQVGVTVPGMSGISLWSPESPTLYGVQVSLTVPGETGDVYTTRTGFREATFTVNGFELNGAPYEIFGLNRHQLYPYTGMAAPERLQRRDAEIIRTELNCNMVRCSHYPQSDWFLDACDELGLMVWEEPPGWGYVGDAAFQADVLQDMHDLVVRDRSRPSLIVWATRLNETSSANNEALYAQTNQIAASLDGTRQTTGAMNDYSLTDWNQQVFAYDDYHSSTSNGVTNAELNPPIGGGVPYLVSEAVGALDGAPLYRFIDPQATLALQAKLHAQVHSLAGASGYAGLLGWCGIDYASVNGTTTTPSPSTASASPSPAASTAASRVWRNLKTPGVLDTFRVSKPGASVYAAQRPAGAAPFVLPAFSWDFSSGSSGNPSGPGNGAIAFTNCDSVAAYVGTSTTPVTAAPDTTDYPHLAYPPAFLNFGSLSGSGSPDLRLVGLVGGAVAVTVQMSSDTALDRLSVVVDDAAIVADATDATRFTVLVVDAYGNQRHLGSGTVTVSVTGPGILVGDSSLDVGAYGTSFGGFVRGVAGATGTVTVTATHPTYGTASATVSVAPGARSAAALGAGGPRSLNPEAVVAGSPPVGSSPTTSAATGTLAAAGSGSPPAAAPSTAAPSTAALRAALRRALVVRGPGARIERLLRDGDTATFDAPSAGVLTIGWYATVGHGHGHGHTRRRVLVATASAHVARAGHARVHLHLTARGRTLLRGVHRERLEAEASFRSRGADGREVTTRVTREITVRP